VLVVLGGVVGRALYAGKMYSWTRIRAASATGIFPGGPVASFSWARVLWPFRLRSICEKNHRIPIFFFFWSSAVSSADPGDLAGKGGV